MRHPAESTPVPPSPVPSSWDEIARQLTAALARPDSDTQLRAAIRAWCAEGRHLELPPEEFLVAMKQQLLLLPALQPRDDGTRRNPAFERIVTLCIEEYFTTVKESPAAAASVAHDAVAG